MMDWYLQPPRKGDKTYEQNIFDEFKRLAKRWPDPDKLTPAHRKYIRKLCSNASFASFGRR